MRSLIILTIAVIALGGSHLCAEDLPKSWIDKDTGHRVFRLTEEPGSSGLYFNLNAYTPDGKQMVYSAPDGIHVLDLAGRCTRLLVPNPPTPAATTDGTPKPGDAGIPAYLRNRARVIATGRRTSAVFFTRFDTASRLSTVYRADVYTGQITKLADLPPRASIASINADETLGAGAYTESAEDEAREYGRGSPVPPASGAAGQKEVPQAGNLVQPEGKGAMMERRFAARIPVVLFTIDLNSGKVTVVLRSTDWIGHILFSPTDPKLLMYCHEGPWHKLDRIWMIRTDGSRNVLIHRRTMAMEIAGHEFWSPDGRTVWYDWQYPRGEAFFLAGYNLESQKRTAYHLQRDEWSIHFNLTADESLFAGDGGDSGQVARAADGQWIQLFRPELLKVAGLNQADFWQPGVFRSERLVNMSHHNYRLEPNVRFSPDKKLVIFTSNMFGPSYVFGVEVEKAAAPKASEVVSTPELAGRFSPAKPSPAGNVW